MRATPKPPAEPRRVYRGITVDRALSLVVVEVSLLREWLDVDPDTPMRAECAARLHELADLIGAPR